MSFKTTMGLAALAAPLTLAALPAQAAPMPPAGCKSDAAEMARNKKLAMEFFRAGITTEQRLALLDPSYVQHNPIYVKRAAADKISTLEAFRRIQDEGAARRAAAPPPTGPQPPAADNAFIVLAECDYVTIVRKAWRQDPTAAPGSFYDYYPYDIWQVKNGKLAVHYDAFTIDPPSAPPPAR